MKFNSVLLAVVGIIVFSSCGDELKPSEQISGLWNFTSIVFSECEMDSDNETQLFGNASCEELNGETKCVNGTVNFVQGIFTQRTNYLIDDVLDKVELETGTYSFSDSSENELMICVEGGECRTGIVSFTDSTMRWTGRANGCTFIVNGLK